MRIPPIAVLCCALAWSLGGTGCVLTNPFETKVQAPNPNAPTITRAPLATTTGRKAAVLSVHLRKAFPDACMFGITLTNNLDIKVTNLSIRFAAYIRDGIRYDAITRNFYQIRPTESQYREITFTGIHCNEINYIGVSDPGRCAIGEANRFTTAEGDCAKFIDIAESRLVSLRVERNKRVETLTDETPAETPL